MASADFRRIPWLAPAPVEAMMATGVASPSAHGQEMTSTAIAQLNANSNPAPVSSHTASVTAEMPITTGTNTPAILSARREIGALEAAACSTSAMMPDSVVSCPTFSARIVK